MRRLFLVLGFLSLALLGACDAPMQLRFDSVYFFQSEEELAKKKVNLEHMSIYMRNLQAAISKALKNAKNQQIPATKAYVVVAVRSDNEVAVWLDAEPAMHEYFDYEITEAVRKLGPFQVDSGIVVFAIKMAINTPTHIEKAIPEPKEWKAAKAKVGDPSDIEQVVLAAWPESE